VWQRPRFEGKGKPPLLLKDCPDISVPKERFEQANLIAPANS